MQDDLFIKQNPFALICEKCGTDSGGRAQGPQQWDCDTCGSSNHDDLRAPTVVAEDPAADLADLVAAIDLADDFASLKAAVRGAILVSGAKASGVHLDDVNEKLVAQKNQTADAVAAHTSRRTK